MPRSGKAVIVSELPACFCSPPHLAFPPPMPLLRTCLGLLLLNLVLWVTPGRALADEPAAPPAEQAGPPAAEVEFFERKIRPLLAAKCLECHGINGDQKVVAKGGLRLDSRRGVLEGGDTGPAVTPGKPEESLLIEAVSYQTESLQMPPQGKLSEAERDLLSDWVRRGAVFPGRDEATASPHRTQIDYAAGKKFWSFQPVQAHPAPTVGAGNWPRQKLDFFILSRLEQEGLAPSEPADRRTLLRRLSFDLLGLPPTADEIAAFEADTAPDACERLVERLLASPRYGERWGRYWLDLVRYADTLEMWAQDKVARAWHYRDWVVEAMNADVPYDRFLHLQLAADQFPDALPRDLAALGFLGLSPSYWKELKLDPSVIKTVVADEWEERIQMLSGTVLGLTVACARCHDHKQDPIGAEDYYALAGVLASTRVVPRPLLPPADARVVQHVRSELEKLTAERDRLRGIKPPTPESELQAEELTARIAALEGATPQLGAPVAYGIEDAAIAILPDGPDRTKIEFQPGQAQNVALQIRGNPANVGSVVPRRFVKVLSAVESPRPFAEGSGRRELAQALTSESAPLVARVIVNRVWRHHFGRGLVETPSNFGATGMSPTHPELLDDLAARFMAEGWSLKTLHRELLLSATYRQSSRTSPAQRERDPDNLLLGRMSQRRLDVEAWRDAMLTAANALQPTLRGPDAPLEDPANRRRTLYANIKRRELNPLLGLNDFPDPTQHVSHRDATITPLQQLFVLNSPLMIDLARQLAERVEREVPGDVSSQVRQVWQWLYQRQPTGRELQVTSEFLQKGPDAATKSARWRQVAQALLSSNEFQYVD